MISNLFDSSYYIPCLFRIDPLHRPNHPTIHTNTGSFISYVFNLFTHNYMLIFSIFHIVLGSIFHHSSRLYPSHNFKFSIQPIEIGSQFDRLIHMKLGTTMIPSLSNVVMKGQNQNRCLIVSSLLQKGNFFKRILTYSVNHYAILKHG